MAPTATPQDVTGYLASPAANQRHASCWHIDPYCPPEIGPRRAVHGTRGLVALAAAQATRGRAPCAVCAYDVVLAATAAAEPDAPGMALPGVRASRAHRALQTVRHAEAGTASPPGR